ncbi:leucine-rich repeat neuronal protein 4 [Siniperca chuatsi]|uniref:leucine-rich repeat neuronal protein 4 n=1 Tax=Siniperca chuatsi TaxID=119488 RepID=UPI001CE17A0E|nr:leucine-rich repeat neuronal protein 4 [Siniperca chuatsi]
MREQEERQGEELTHILIKLLQTTDSTMAASRDLAFPLVIVCMVLIRGYSPLPTTSQVAGNPMKPRGFSTEAFVLHSEDYHQDEDTVTPILPNTVSSVKWTFQRCDYKPCLENQIPCADLAASTGCSCPGITLHNVAPEAPNLKSVSWNGSEVVIRWCAPNSYVTGYIVTVGGQERQKFEKDKRSGGVGNIDHISEVCVVAVNDAGDNGSCMMYQPRDNSLPLKAGLIGGALGFLLLLLLAVLLWRHKRQRKQEASISMHETAGTQ